MARMLCLLVFFCTGSATAEVYRWVDESGAVHFSDRRPGGDRVETIELESAPSVSTEQIKALDRQRKALLKAAEQRQRSAQRESTRAAKDRERGRRKAAEWRAQCDDTRERIAEIESELRSGYSAARGEVLHRRLEQYREREASQCR